MAIANELQSFGISVAAVMPATLAGVYAARVKRLEGDDIYAEESERSEAVMEKDELGNGPRTAASFIHQISGEKACEAALRPRAKYKLFVALSRICPPLL
jgi:hypothetical protein